MSVSGTALSAHAYRQTLPRRTERTEKEDWSGKVAVPDEGRRPCSGRDFSAAAEVRKPMSPPRRSGKCGVSDLGKGWSPPGANSSPAAASTGSSMGRRLKTFCRSELNIIRIGLTRSRMEVGGGCRNLEDRYRSCEKMPLMRGVTQSRWDYVTFADSGHRPSCWHSAPGRYPPLRVGVTGGWESVAVDASGGN